MPPCPCRGRSVQLATSAAQHKPVRQDHDRYDGGGDRDGDPRVPSALRDRNAGQNEQREDDRLPDPDRNAAQHPLSMRLVGGALTGL